MSTKKSLDKNIWTSLVAQWLRICLPMQGTRVQALVQEDPTCHGAAKPMCHNYWACALEPMNHNYWACALEPVSHNYWACAPQLLKPACSRARMPQLLSPCSATREATAMRSPRTATKSSPHSPQLEKSLHAAMSTQCTQKKKNQTKTTEKRISIAALFIRDKTCNSPGVHEQRYGFT